MYKAEPKKLIYLLNYTKIFRTYLNFDEKYLHASGAKRHEYWF